MFPLKPATSIRFKFTGLCVLASASRYCDSLFGGQFREAENDEVVLSTVDGTIVNCLIEFAYTGNIRIDA